MLTFAEVKKPIKQIIIMEEKKNRLWNFLKKGITFEEKVKLISDWEEDRCSDGEYVYDLDEQNDAWAWADLYDVKTLYKCRQEGRYWLGGWQFNCNGLNDCEPFTAWCITEEKIDKFLSDILDDVLERFEDYMKSYGLGTSEEKENAIKDFSSYYSDLIDFKGYLEGQKPKEYIWVGVSNDGSYKEVAKSIFHTKKEAYNSMRNEVLSKMKWNTEFDEDFENDTDVVGYEVRFSKNSIIQESFNGKYLYKIMETQEIPVCLNEVWDKMIREINTIS